jgi:hypothetical protein
MTQLNSIPAFGWENKFCNADDYRYTCDASPKKNHNMIKKVGYVPIVGCVVGIVRIFIIATNQDWMGPLPNKFNHIVRGTIEFLSLGFLLIIPDLIITIHRRNVAKKAALALP